MIVLFAANRSCCSARSSVTGNSCICYCIVVLCGAKGQAFILVLLDKKGQEVDHARPWDATKMQLKQPNLGLESTQDFFWQWLSSMHLIILPHRAHVPIWI